MVAAGVRGCDCLKAPRCPETPVQQMGFGTGQEREMGGFSLQSVYNRCVKMAFTVGMSSLAALGVGSVDLVPSSQKVLGESPGCMELAGPGGKGPGQLVRKALCIFWIHLSQCYLAVPDPVTVCTWEQPVSPFGCVWRAGLGQLSVELLACISVMLGSLLFALALSILVSCLSPLTWKLVTPLFGVTTIHFL